MSDLIDRQKAIESLGEEPMVWNDDDAFALGERNQWRCDVEAIKRVLSAESEIVRCKDCKHYGCILYSGTQFEHGDCFGHEEYDYTFEVKPDDFCSQAERRTDETD